MNYYKRHLGDYARDTGWLTTYQHGVYVLLLDWYYSNERPIPLDLVYRIVKARSGPERRAVDEVIAAFFDVTKQPGFAHNKHADIEVAKYQAKRKANSLIAKERESTKRAQSVVDSCEVGEPSHKPLANSHNKKQKNAPDGAVSIPDVDPKVVADFLKIRKAKRAPLTETALAGIQREAAKAGVTLEAALRTCCERGWTGFKAEWVAGQVQSMAVDRAQLPGGGRRAL